MREPLVTTTALAESQLDRGGRSAWGAIFAGTAVALAVFVLLSLLGVGIGFATVDPFEADAVGTSPTGATIYLFLSQLVALFAGGYTAGRLAGVLHTIGSALHGATVWAVTTIATVWLATSAVSGLLGAAGSALSSLGSAAGSAVEAVIPDDFSLPDVSASTFSFDALPPAVQTRLRQAGITPDNFQEEAREAFRSVVSEREQAQATQAITSTAQDIIASPGNAGQDLEQLADQLFGRGGVLSEEDRQQALTQIEQRLGITPQEATQIVDDVQARAQQLQQRAEAAIEEARVEAAQAIEQAADAAATAGFLAFFASLIGLGAAVGGAVVGRVKPVREVRY